MKSRKKLKPYITKGERNTILHTPYYNSTMQLYCMGCWHVKGRPCNTFINNLFKIKKRVREYYREKELLYS